MSKRVTEGKSYQESEQEILNIAGKLFHKLGYHNTSMQNIADQAGMTKAALYYYFDSKEKILSEIYTQSITKVYNRLLLERENNEIEPVLTNTIRIIFEEMEDKPVDFLVLLQIGDFVKSEYAESVIEIRKKVFRVVKDAVEKSKELGTVRKDMDTMTITLHIFGSLNWAFYFHPERKKDAHKLTNEMVDLILNGILIK